LLPIGEERVAREVAVQLLFWPFWSVGDRLDQQIATHEGAFPGMTEASEDFFSVASAAGLVDADLEGLQLFCNPLGEVQIVSSRCC
jgi:hypothetical protein